MTCQNLYSKSNTQTILKCRLLKIVLNMLGVKAWPVKVILSHFQHQYPMLRHKVQ